MSIYSFNPFRAAAYLWRSRRVDIVPIPKKGNIYPLYNGKPSFIARWALVFLSLDVMYMCVANHLAKQSLLIVCAHRTSMTYECLNGNDLFPNLFKNVRKDKPEEVQSASSNPPSLSAEASESKSMSKRVAFTAFHVGMGGLIAVWLLSQRTSWVRSMAVLRPPASKPNAPAKLFIEVAGHPNGYGHPFNIRDCSLMGYSEANNIMLVNTGTEGKFAFYPLGAMIGGKQMPSTGDLAKINMLKVWKALGGKVERKA